MENMKNIDFVLPYPPWGTMKTVISLFGIGKDQVNEWSTQGLVLRRKKEEKATSVQFRCSDINRVMTDEAKGNTSRLARFCK